MQSATPDSSKVQRVSSNTVRRSVLACNRCRGRKTKCTGTPPHPCNTCQEAEVACVYTETERRIQVPESYLLELQARAGLSDSPTTSRHDSDASPFVFDEASSNANDDDWWYKGMDGLLLTRSGERQYVGTASSLAFAQQFSPATDDNLAWDTNPMYKDPASLSRPSVTSLPQLPPYEFAKRLFAAQYVYIGTIFSFLQPHVFEQHLAQIYKNPPNPQNREECLTYCQILLVLAYGQMYSVNQWAGSDGPPGFTWFKHALWMLPDIHQEGSIMFVEVLGLIAPYMQNLNRKDAAFLYIGLALRMAISLGLHKEVDDPGMDIVEREHRRRVWWSVYSMDRIISVKSGNPISIHDEDIDVAMPSPIPGIDPDLSPPRVLAHYTQLSRILGNIGASVYRKKHKSGSSLLSSVQTNMNDLADWLKHVPPELRIDFAGLDKPISREGVSTFLHYFQCLNMTTRPLLLHVCQQRLSQSASGISLMDWRDGLSQNVVAVLEHAMTAACASTMIMDAAARQGLFATYGFMDGEHAFSAALTLVMVNVAFPYNEREAMALETALGILKGMAERGNEYIQARRKLLMDVLSTIGRRPYGDLSAGTGTRVPNAFSNPDLPHPGLPYLPQSNHPPPVGNFQPFQDVPLDLDFNEDPKFWEEISGNIDIDMATGWMESALRSGGYQVSDFSSYKLQ